VRVPLYCINIMVNHQPLFMHTNQSYSRTTTTWFSMNLRFALGEGAIKEQVSGVCEREGMFNFGDVVWLSESRKAAMETMDGNIVVIYSTSTRLVVLCIGLERRENEGDLSGF